MFPRQSEVRSDTAAVIAVVSYSESFVVLKSCHFSVPTGSPSRGGAVTVYVYDIKQPSLPTPFYSVLVSFSVFMALSTVFCAIHSPDNSPFSLSVFFRSYRFLTGPFNLHVSL